MNLASKTAGANAAVGSDGIVAAGVYVDGRRIANIAIEEASSWRSKPGHVVWIGLHEPDMALLSSVQRQFELHDLAIEDADHAHQRPKIEQYGDALFIVARSSTATASHSARRICSSAKDISCRSGTAPRRPTSRCANVAKAALGRWPAARTTSSTPSSTSSSTTTPPCSKPFRRKSKPWRRRCSPAP